MNVYRGQCEKCGQTKTYQLGWHWTRYQNTCVHPFVVTVSDMTKLR